MGNLEENLERGRQQIREHLGIEPELGELLAKGRRVLGADIARQCVELILSLPESRRPYHLGTIAGLTVATETLGLRWWNVPRSITSWGLPKSNVTATPAETLREVAAGAEATLQLLEGWAADDVADGMWGAPVAWIDLNDQTPEDRVPLPEHVNVGQRLVLAFDPGSRIDAVVTNESNGVPGSLLDLDSARHAPPNEAWWGWAVVGEIYDSPELEQMLRDFVR